MLCSRNVPLQFHAREHSLCNAGDFRRAENEEHCAILRILNGVGCPVRSMLWKAGSAIGVLYFHLICDSVTLTHYRTWQSKIFDCHLEMTETLCRNAHSYE